MYEYSVTIERVVDGDTIDCSIDLGFEISFKQRVRVLDIDTPEIRTRNLNEKQRGFEAKAVVEKLLIGNEAFGTRIKTQYDARGKFGRVLGEFFYREEPDGPWLNLADTLLSMGLAKRYKEK